MKFKNLILFISFFLIVQHLFSQQKKVVSVRFKEHKKIKTTALHKLVLTKKGSVLDSIILERDVRQLKRLAAVAHSYYQVTKKENGYEVVYGVQENHTVIPLINFYNTNDGELAYNIGIYEYNFLGKNITIGGLYQKDVFDSFAFNLRAPYLVNKHIGLAFNYSNFTSREPVFLDNGTADYKYNNTSYELLGLYQFNFTNRIELGATFFTEDYQYESGATAADVPQDFKVDKLLAKLIYEYNNLNYHFQYVSGFKSSFNFQYVTSTEDVLPNFIIFWNDFNYFKRISKKGNWGSRLRVGLATNSNSPFSPFSVDNNLNVRGVGNTIDRGTGVIVLNTEYRHTLLDKKTYVLQSNVFIDGGSWRNPGGDFGDFSQNQNIRIYPGVGFRFIHKKIFNAVFRIDYGYGVTKDATQGFVFGIGQYF